MPLSMHFRVSRRLTVALPLGLSLALAACGGGDGDGGGGGDQITISAGNNQLGFVGNFATTLPAVTVTEDGAPQAGVNVTFAIAAGGGTLVGGNATTNANGVASPRAWRYGPAGPQQLTVSVPANPDLEPVTVNATSSAAPASQFDIIVEFLGTAPSAGRQQAFFNAAARWEQLIVGDVANISNVNACTSGGQELHPAPGNVDDLIIYARIEPIDGAGGILGQAGPCYFRNNGLFSITGIMTFDSDDVTDLENAGRFGEVVLHEMGHVLGFGIFWEAGPPGLDLIRPGPCLLGNYFRGQGAVQAFYAASTTNSFPRQPVPIEDRQDLPCPGGTRDGHWREADLTNELMTGFLGPGPVAPLSAISVAALRDAGYIVNDAVADAFTFIPLATLRAPALSADQMEIRETLSPWTMRGVDEGGRVLRTIQR